MALNLSKNVKITQKFSNLRNQFGAQESWVIPLRKTNGKIIVDEILDEKGNKIDEYKTRTEGSTFVIDHVKSCCGTAKITIIE